jgi:hypothetical protein
VTYRLLLKEAPAYPNVHRTHNVIGLVKGEVFLFTKVRIKRKGVYYLVYLIEGCVYNYNHSLAGEEQIQDRLRMKAAIIKKFHKLMGT